MMSEQGREGRGRNRERIIRQNGQELGIEINKLGLSCAKLRLNWARMLRLPLNKGCVELYGTVT